MLLYLRGQEGRGIGLGHKIRAYALQDRGRDTVQANVDLGLPVDSRDYGVGAQVLRLLGVSSMRLMTNNPAKVRRPPPEGRARAARRALPPPLAAAAALAAQLRVPPPPPDPSLRAAQYAGLSGYGLSIAERVPCMTAVNVENVKYMRTKQQKMGHWLPVGFDDMVTELEEAVQLDLGVGAGDGGEPGGAAAELQEAGACALSLEEQIDEAASELARLRALLGDSAVNGVSSASSRSSGVPGGEKNLSR